MLKGIIFLDKKISLSKSFSFISNPMSISCFQRKIQNMKRKIINNKIKRKLRKLVTFKFFTFSGDENISFIFCHVYLNDDIANDLTIND